MRKIQTGLAALAAGLAIGASAPASAQDTIPIGVVMAQTGAVAVIGVQATSGIIFAIDEANEKGGVRGHKLELKIEDDQAKPEQSIISFNKLADLVNPPVVFTGFSGPSVALAPLATRRKVVTVNAAAQSNALGKAPPYLINTIPTIGYEIEILCKWAAGKGHKTFAILFENGTSGISGRDDYRKYCGDAGMKNVAEESNQFGQTDFRPALLKIADAKPDVMLVALTSGMPQMTEQYKQLGLKFKVMGTTFFKHPEVIGNSGSEGFIHTLLRVVTPEDINARYKAKYGKDIEFFAFLYYNATQIMLQAIGKVIDDKKPLTGENVHAAIFQIGSFDTPIPMKFRNNQNTAAADVDIYLITGQKDTLLEKLDVSK
jgi:branched-chain amino acid transport system substrate-binding protein